MATLFPDLTTFLIARIAAKRANLEATSSSRIALVASLLPGLGVVGAAAVAGAAASSQAATNVQLGTTPPQPGDNSVEVPDLYQLEQKGAVEKRLSQAGLKLGAWSTAYANVDSPTVLLQSPAPGENVARGTAVSVLRGAKAPKAEPSRAARTT